MDATRTWLWVGIGLSLACSSSRELPGTINQQEPVDPGTRLLLTQATEDQTALASFVDLRTATAAMTPAKLQTTYGLARNDGLTFDPTTADGLPLIQAQPAFALDDDGLAVLKQSGVAIRTGSTFITLRTATWPSMARTCPCS
jgi:hypothetical protein